MMISRHIGYQEKNAKHRTAPSRNPGAAVLRLIFGPRLAPARLPAGASCAGLRRVATICRYAPLLARIWLTWLVAVASSWLMFAFGSVSTASITGSSVL